MLRRLLSHLRNRSASVPGLPGGSAASPPTRLSWRKGLLVGASVLVCLYAVSVIYFARSVPDIGLHTAFSCVVNRVDRNKLRPVGDRFLEKKDVVVALGDQPTKTWPDLLHELSNVGTGSDEEVLVHLERAGTGEPFAVWC